MSHLPFTIGEVAALLGITPKTIQHYDQIGLLTPSARDTNNYRLYDMTQVTQLQQILRLKQFGLSLKQIEIILKSENPDELVQVVLSQHVSNVRNEISRLQEQLAVTQDFLSTGETFSQSGSLHKSFLSAMTAFSDAVKRRSTSVSDILVAVEHDVMARLDQFEWDTNYEVFWHDAGIDLMDRLTDEGLFTFWMERYVALATMDADDLQGATWIEEFSHSPVRQMLKYTLVPAKSSILPEKQQQKIFRLLPVLLYQYGSPLQKQFVDLLTKS